MILNSPYISGSLTVTGNTIFTGSVVISGSTTMTASYASNAELLDGLDSTVFTLTSSFNAQTASFTAFTASLNAFSASINTATSSFSGRVGALESYTASLNLKTASFATTGSNNFTSTQHIADTTNPTGFDTTASLYSEGGLGIKKDAYISSSLYIKGNLTVYGTQSVSYITSSQLNISTNIITVNTSTPSIRFGGLAVQDSGSVNGLTGSLLWDSQNNSWLYNNPSGSGNYDSSLVIMGPRNSSTLGNEVGLSCNYLVQGHGHHHTTSSAIYHDSACTNFYSNALFISASGNVGIGTSCPANVLHTKSSLPRIIVDTTDRYAVFNMWACGSEKGAMYWDNTDLALKFESNQGYWFIAGGSERLRITCGGNVGIGTCIPTSISTYTTLEIRGATGGGVKIGKTSCSQFNIQHDGTDAYFNNTANGALYIYTNDAERMKITSGGIVGINTDNLTSPGLSGNTLFIRASSSNVGQSAIAIQDYRKCTRWVINGQDGIDNFNLAIYSTPNNTNDYTRRLTINQEGNIGIGSACPKIRLQVTPCYNAEAPILGCASGVAIFTSSNTNYGLQFNSTSDGSFHIQSQRFDAISTAYNLILNYAGGNVGVGLSNPVEGMDVQMALRIRCNTPNFTAVCNSLVIDYVNTCIFGSSPTARYYSIGCTGVSAGHQFLVGVPLSGYTALNINGNGIITRQCQPYFYADTLNGASLAGATTPVWTNIRASQGSGYSTSTGRFTAPVTGVYAFSWVYLYGGISNYGACIDDGFSLNGTMIYSGNRFKICQKATGDGYVAVQGSVVLKLTANDYFSVLTQNAGDASLVGYGGSTWGYLTGTLI